MVWELRLKSLIELLSLLSLFAQLGTHSFVSKSLIKNKYCHQVINQHIIRPSKH